jgi:hypothetical protein
VTGLRAETSTTPAIATLSVAVAAVGHALAGGTVTLAALPQLVALGALAWSVGEHLFGRRWLSAGLLAILQLTTHLALEFGPGARTSIGPTSIATASAASAADLADGLEEPAAMGHAAIGHGSTHAMAAMDHAAMGHGSTHAMAAMDHAVMGHSSTHAMAGMDHAAMGHGSLHAMPGMQAMPEMGTSGSLADVASGGVPGGMSGAMHSGVAGVVTMSAAHLFVLLVGVGLVTQAHRWVHRVAGILGRLVPGLPDAPVASRGVGAVLSAVPEMPWVRQRWLVSGVSRRGPPGCGVLAS